jgi:hypothetical protein
MINIITALLVNFLLDQKRNTTVGYCWLTMVTVLISYMPFYLP